MIAPELQARFWPNVNKAPGQGPRGDCWLWAGGRDSYGYGTFCVPVSRKVKAHRTIWNLEHGDIPKGLCVLHRCDTPACVNPQHLFLGTDADNMADRDAKGRTAKGDRSGSRMHPEKVCRGEAVNTAKLTSQKVLRIRELIDAGMSLTGIGLEFGITKNSVWKIKTGINWKHV